MDGPKVRPQVEIERKRLAATLDGASERALPCVDKHVALEARVFVKSLAAAFDGADVQLAAVDDQVLLKRGTVSKDKPTSFVGASKWVHFEHGVLRGLHPSCFLLRMLDWKPGHEPVTHRYRTTSPDVTSLTGTGTLFHFRTLTDGSILKVGFVSLSFSLSVRSAFACSTSASSITLIVFFSCIALTAIAEAPNDVFFTGVVVSNTM